MSLHIDVPSYRWRPLAAVDGTPEVGRLVPLWHRVWRIVAIHPLPEVDWTDDERRHVGAMKAEFRERNAPVAVVLGPPDPPVDPVAHLSQQVSVRLSGWRRRALPMYPDEHWPSCARCAEPLPCRERMAAKIAAAELAKLGRYETAGVCPACQEPVTARQQSLTFSENLVLPGGPPVTFHQRSRCRYSAEKYEKAWVAADPNRRRATLTCGGHVTVHHPMSYSCTEGVECPGSAATHQSYSVCRCPEHTFPGRSGCMPDRRAVREELGHL